MLAEIFLKVALNTIKEPNQLNVNTALLIAKPAI
jgi:hypothetical protein